MTVPSGADPAGYSLNFWEGVLGSLVGGGTGISGLAGLTQAAVQAAKMAEIEANAVLNTILGLIFNGLRNGIPLALAIIESIIVKLFGLIPGFSSITAALDAISEVPAVAALVHAITGAVGTLTDITTFLGSKWTDLAGVVAKFIALIAGVGGTAIGDVVTAIANGVTALAHWVAILDSTGEASAAALGTLIYNIVHGWKNALDALNLSNPLAFIEQIPRSIPALVRDVEGGLSAVGSGWTKDAEGGIAFVGDGLTHIFKDAEGAILSLPHISEQLAYVASLIANPSVPVAGAPVANPGVSDVMIAGHTAQTALVSAIEQAGVTVEHDIIAGAAQLGGVVSGTAGQLEDAAVNAIGGAQAAASQFGQALAGAFGGLFGGFTGQPPAAQVAPIDLHSAASIVASHSLSIAQIEQQLSGGGSGGLRVVVPMSSTLPSSFTSMGPLAPAGLSAIVNSAMYNVSTAPTNTQTVSGTWNAIPSTDGYVLILAANSTFTTYVYLRIYNKILAGHNIAYFELGCVVEGVQTIFSTDNTVGVAELTTNIPFTLECDATGLHFAILFNGNSIGTYTDSSNGGLGTAKFGASYRDLGFATSEASLPGAITQWGATSPAATIGSGFRISKASGSSSIGSGAISGGAFDNLETITSDFSYNSSNGQLTCLNSGWYMFTARFGLGSSGTGQLYKNGTLVAYGIYSSGDAATIVNTPVYCAANDYLQPGISNSNTLVSSGAEAGSFWTVSLLNCGTIS